MEEKQGIRISLSTLFLILAILVIAVMAYFMYVGKKSSDEQIKQLEEKISNLQINTEKNNIVEENISENQESNLTTNNSEIKIVSDICNGGELHWPSIYIDESGYIYYNAKFNYSNNEKEYKPICNENKDKIKPNTIIVQSPTVRNGLDPNITTTYIFLTDSKVYQFSYYFNENLNKEVFSEYAEIKYDISLSKYKFLEVKDQYGGHTIDMNLISANGKENKLTDIMLAYDLKTNKDLISDSWHMDFEKEYDI